MQKDMNPVLNAKPKITFSVGPDFSFEMKISGAECTKIKAYIEAIQKILINHPYFKLNTPLQIADNSELTLKLDMVNNPLTTASLNEREYTNNLTNIIQELRDLLEVGKVDIEYKNFNPELPQYKNINAVVGQNTVNMGSYFKSLFLAIEQLITNIRLEKAKTQFAAYAKDSEVEATIKALQEIAPLLIAANARQYKENTDKTLKGSAEKGENKKQMEQASNTTTLADLKSRRQDNANINQFTYTLDPKTIQALLQFSNDFKNILITDKEKDEFNAALFGKLEYVDVEINGQPDTEEKRTPGLIDGDTKPLKNSLRTHPHITCFLRNNLHRLQGPAKEYGKQHSMESAHTITELLNLIAAIKLEINTAVREMQEKQKDGKSPFSTEVNTFTKKMELLFQKIENQLKQASKNLNFVESEITGAAIREIKKALDDGLSNITNGINNKKNLTPEEKITHTTITTAISKTLSWTSVTKRQTELVNQSRIKLASLSIHVTGKSSHNKEFENYEKQKEAPSSTPLSHYTLTYQPTDVATTQGPWQLTRRGVGNSSQQPIIPIDKIEGLRGLLTNTEGNPRTPKQIDGALITLIETKTNMHEITVRRIGEDRTNYPCFLYPAKPAPGIIKEPSYCLYLAEDNKTIMCQIRDKINGKLVVTTINLTQFAISNNQPVLLKTIEWPIGRKSDAAHQIKAPFDPGFKKLINQNYPCGGTAERSSQAEPKKINPKQNGHTKNTPVDFLIQKINYFIESSKLNNLDTKSLESLKKFLLANSNNQLIVNLISAWRQQEGLDKQSDASSYLPLFRPKKLGSEAQKFIDTLQQKYGDNTLVPGNLPSKKPSPLQVEILSKDKINKSPSQFSQGTIFFGQASSKKENTGIVYQLVYTPLEFDKVDPNKVGDIKVASHWCLYRCTETKKEKIPLDQIPQLESLFTRNPNEETPALAVIDLIRLGRFDPTNVSSIEKQIQLEQKTLSSPKIKGNAYKEQFTNKVIEFLELLKKGGENCPFVKNLANPKIYKFVKVKRLPDILNSPNAVMYITEHLNEYERNRNEAFANSEKVRNGVDDSWLKMGKK